MIVQELYQIQSRHGFLPRAALEALAERLALPLYRIQEVVSFFPHFRTSHPHPLEILVCRDMACQLRGSQQILQELSNVVARRPDSAQVRFVSCLGRCDRAPAVRFLCNQADANGGHAHSVRNCLGRSLDALSEVARALIADGPVDQVAHDSDVDHGTSHCQDWRINVYAGLPWQQRYETVRRYVAESQAPEQRAAAGDRIIAALETAGLLGMGGAGGRAYKKWSEVRGAQGDRKFVVCNGDESEPATFKDRELLLRVPHLVLEGVILAGLMLGAERGYIYVRHEYEEQIQALETALEEANRLGVCGSNILGSGRSFPIEVFVSPGGYICGEQTALIEAIEDRRAEPRNRPPELQTNGLWDMPTLLNNVETLAWVPSIVLREAGQWFANQAVSADFAGARFFSVSGDVARPGVYEVPIGIKLGELIDRHAGGMRPGQSLKAVALSGPSGGFLPAVLPLSAFPADIKNRLPVGATAVDIRELELDIALFRKWRLMLGGGIVVYGSDADLVAQAQVCSEFFRQESCGKCVPCRIGSTKLAEVANQLAARQINRDQLAQLQDRRGPLVELATVMRQTAICGLGTVAANPLSTLLTHFPNEVDRYVSPPANPE